MATTPNRYAADLGNRDSLAALAETPQQIRAAVDDWSEAQFERSYAPGKWSIRLVLIHLAQTELALTTPAQRNQTFVHPEYGTLTVDWVVNQIAGHDIHHLKQIERAKTP